MKNKKGIRVEGCGRKTTTTAAPFKPKWLKIKRPNIPRVHQTEDDNNTDSNLTTTVTPDGNIAQQDSVVVTLSIGKILYMNKIKIKVKIFLFFLFIYLFLNIFISVLPTSFVILSGCMIYIQYRHRTGWKFGCIPYGRVNKLRDSNDDLHQQESTSVDTTQEELNAHDNVENIGAINTLTNPPPFENVDLFAFTDKNPLGSQFRDRKIARTRKVHMV